MAEKVEKFAVYKTKVGFYKITYTDTHIVGLKKSNHPENMGEASALSDAAYVQITEYFFGKRKSFDLPIASKGTDFQKKVWQALCDIPYGETRSYKDIAIAVGNPKASRAVGMANNRNPIAIVVPCHRVIGSSGKLVGYAGGLETKEKLLALEAEHKHER